MGWLIERLQGRSSCSIGSVSQLLSMLLLFLNSLLFTCAGVASLMTPAEAQFPSIPHVETEVKKKALEKNAWNGHESTRFKNAGKESEADGNYPEAIRYFDQALKIQFDEQALEGKAECLMKLNRQKEALPLLRQLNEKTTSQTAWKMRIACLVDLKKYPEAFAVCDENRQCWYPDFLSFLLRSKVYFAEGDKLAARQSLLDGYYHCARYQTDKEELLDALESLKEEPSIAIPKHTEGNNLVLSKLMIMQKFDAPLNERELSSILKMKFEPGAFSGEKEQPVTQWMATDRTSSVEQIMESTTDGELKLRSNLDLTYITADDLRQKFGRLQNSMDFSKPAKIEKPVVEKTRILKVSAPAQASIWTRPAPLETGKLRNVGRGPEKYIQCSNGYLSFEFSESDPAQLYFICRHFNAPSAKKSMASQEDLSAHLKVVDEALSRHDYATAASSLEAHWSDTYTGLQHEKLKSMMLQKKALLIQSYRQKPSIQNYLKVASLRYITEDIQTKNRFGIELPTGDEYTKKKWHASASILDPSLPESYYTIWADTYSAVCVAQSAPLFKVIYSQLLNCVQDRGWQHDIAAPKSSLIDEIE